MALAGLTTERAGTLMMLPSDLALRDDPAMRVFVEIYAKDQGAFFAAFAAAFGKLLALGCPPHVQPTFLDDASPVEKLSAEFRDLCMHGSELKAKEAMAKGANVHALEATSGRSALHKAAFWGHTDIIAFLTKECRIDPNVQDSEGDTALHDAAKFGHEGVVQHLLAAGTNLKLRNKDGKTVLDVAVEHMHTAVVARLQKAKY